MVMPNLPLRLADPVGRRVMTAKIFMLMLLVAGWGLPVQGAQLITATTFGPPTIRLEPTKTLYLTRTAVVSLPAGETVLTMPLTGLKIAPADVWLEVAPADLVRLIAMETSPDVPDAVLWRLQARQEVAAELTVTYPIEGLKWGIEYSGTLLPDGAIDLAGALWVTNGVGRSLSSATLVGEGFTVVLSLSSGATVQQELPLLAAHIPADQVTRRFVYDKSSYGDAPVELLGFRPQRSPQVEEEKPQESEESSGGSGAMPAGTLRLYSAPSAGGELIATSSIPYTPAGEPIEVNLGPLSGVLVTRTRARAVEINKHLDANNKIALFDLEETWELEVRNLREEAVELEVREHHEGVWKLEEASTQYEREDAETLVFHVVVPPGERHKLNYRIRHLNRQP